MIRSEQHSKEVKQTEGEEEGKEGEVETEKTKGDEAQRDEKKRAEEPVPSEVQESVENENEEEWEEAVNCITFTRPTPIAVIVIISQLGQFLQNN